MILLAIHILIVLGLMVRVLLRDELAATSRLAWIVVIGLLPYSGVIIYFLFGEANLGYSASGRIAAVARQIQSHKQDLVPAVPDALPAVPERYRSAFAYSESINGFPALPGNAVELMPDAASARARLIADIDAARHHVNVLYYIWLDDETGTNTARALIRAAQRGVTCRVMADGLGSRKFVRSPLWKEMEAAGVRVAVALPIGNPVMTVLKSRIDLRNHRKITIVDGEITYCGSQNCADPEFRVKEKYGPWIDIMLRVTGPVVAQNQLLFASDWIAHCGGTLQDFPVHAEPQKPGIVAQIMGDGPTERRLATPHLFSALMNSAERSVTITTPYFVPDAIVVESICAAAYRGVDVVMVLPRVNDSKIVAAASRSSYRRLLAAGVAIHEFEGGLLHAKTMTIDGLISFVGSSNLDLRSFDLNYESNLLLCDADLTRQIMARQDDYIGQSSRVRIDEVNAWPIHRRMWNNAVATIGPIL
ncbi:cardiolipin synthase [Sedimentitalea sp. JM2-8]|uniref:Cardiolipin synthase n=1 Tax=Sedimentitalea xiamensis TaxID=3050037 RepID=A0ABT7FEM4_9RHOB|nr:cardiolipin synthase [Sedimentitalea xiamensis]MDK3073571.1 cardiolipin synthase [Sedimentitalea xiamensis]